MNDVLDVVLALYTLITCDLTAAWLVTYKDTVHIVTSMLYLQETKLRDRQEQTCVDMDFSVVQLVFNETFTQHL